MSSELNDDMKVALLMAILKDLTEYEPMVTSISTMKEADKNWRHIAMLRIEETKRLKLKISQDLQS